MISKAVADNLVKTSWIRRMFEEGARLKQERGSDKVLDFTLGNQSRCRGAGEVRADRTARTIASPKHPARRHPTPSFATAPSTTVPLKKSGLSAVCRRAAFSKVNSRKS